MSGEPGADCALCPRLRDFRGDNQQRHPDFFNAPVPAFGPVGARLLIVGLAPGLKGANRTGRPFTGDYAGDLLYETLSRHGFSRGRYDRDPEDGLALVDCRIVNAVRCVPPENKPTTQEVATCRRFLVPELTGPKAPQQILALGAIAHGAVLTAFGLTKARYPFKHAARHSLPNGPSLTDSYHCSRYNTNTGRLTTQMFEAVFAELRRLLDS